MLLPQALKVYCAPTHLSAPRFGRQQRVQSGAEQLQPFSNWVDRLAGLQSDCRAVLAAAHLRADAAGRSFDVFCGPAICGRLLCLRLKIAAN